MPRASLAIPAAALCLLCAPLSVGAVAVVNTPLPIVSDFASDADGWTARTFGNVSNQPNFANFFTSDVFPVAHSPSAGNPGGYVEIADPDNGWTYFSAPSKFLGNQSTAYGGSLNFDLSEFPNGGTLLAEIPFVALVSGTTVLVYDAGDFPAVHPDWTSYTVPFATDAGWLVGGYGGEAASDNDLLAVLGALDGLYIVAEFRTPIVEAMGLDNVVLSPVPVPGALALFAPALAVFGWHARRRRDNNG